MSLALSRAVIVLTALAIWLGGPAPGDAHHLVHAHGEWLAGSSAGLFALTPAGWERRAPGEVRDLAVTSDALWIAGSRGLSVLREGHRPRPVPLGAGARVRGVAALPGGRVAVASEVGLFRGGAGEAFARERALPPGEVGAVAVAGGRVWLARRGTLWRLSTDEHDAAVPAARGLREGWWELRGAVEHAGDTWLVVPLGLWRVRGGGGELERVEVPVAGELRDALGVADDLWVAGSRGVYALRPPSNGAPPAEMRLHADARALWPADDGGVAVLARRGLALLRPAADVPAPPQPRAAPASTLLADDVARAVRSIQIAALRHQGLDPGRLRTVERRARRAGWLPEVRAGLGWDRGSARDLTHDQTFSSGEVRRLFDRTHDRDRGLHADIDLVWDLPRTASPDDAIAVSRERRLVIELRDQVLERVNRLYFERERVRRRVAAAGAAEGGTAVPAADLEALHLRERELTAQLDAWTGGAASRLDADSSPSPRRER